ncbi:DNA-processing protein DprA [Pseudobacillus badius]|uniref:DNA-processing protein DprA n=1 Tax=Bacillus badius TaxID=1455 RepID=UPI001CBF7DE8|nr:DNA-processing protein DprA [Bacillus badius]UAT31804.1 DNA-processing protein DprA [Bacillus badius]
MSESRISRLKSFKEKEEIKLDQLTRKIIHLQHCKGIGWKAIYLLLKQDSNLKNLYHYPPEYFSRTLALSPAQSIAVIEQLKDATLYSLPETYKDYGISAIPIYSSSYPSLLKNLPQPPWVLYAAGNCSLLKQERKLAIVGARKADEYGRKAIQLLVPELIANHYIIVSGLAKGADAFAHEAALAEGGGTIAVIAGGFHHLYPRENLPLARKIVRSGLIVSEFPPNIQPKKWHFPARNRIISGLSLGTVVVQAGKQSGSLITAYCALEQGREVFCVPGRMDDPLSEGTNELIGEGAKLVQKTADILSEIKGK